MTPVPYPADTRAKGWRFELDMERARQSDTWTLAPAEARPWLLMMWATAWEQTPCGSMPNDDELIAARIGMPVKTFAKHKAILLRKWWLAEDGRFYHDVLVQRVIEMMQARRKESDRKALARARTAGVVPQDSANVPRDNHGTTTGLPPESDTGTGTGTSTREEPEHTHLPSSTAAGRACLLMRREGIPDCNTGHPDLLALLAVGASDAEFVGAAQSAASRGKGFAYAIGTLKRQRQEAASTAQSLHRGTMPQRAPTAAEQRMLQAVPSLVAPHLRPPKSIVLEAEHVSPQLLG